MPPQDVCWRSAAIADPGDTVVTFEPGYPCYANIAHALGVATLPVHLDSSTGYRPTPAIARRCRGRTRHGITDRCGGGGESLQSDRVRARRRPHWNRSPGGATSTAATPAWWTRSTTAPPRPVGQRGRPPRYGRGPELLEVLLHDRLATRLAGAARAAVRPWSDSPRTSTSHLPPSPQAAAMGAFDAPTTSTRRARRHGTNRRILVDALRHAGVDDIAPAEGAFYVWADMSAWGDSRSFCGTWLEDLGVAVTPGVDFDSVAGDRFVRFSVAGATEDRIEEAARHLDPWLPHGRRADEQAGHAVSLRDLRRWVASADHGAARSARRMPVPSAGRAPRGSGPVRSPPRWIASSPRRRTRTVVRVCRSDPELLASSSLRPAAIRRAGGPPRTGRDPPMSQRQRRANRR